jgi:hypothetical protein
MCLSLITAGVVHQAILIDFDAKTWSVSEQQIAVVPGESRANDPVLPVSSCEFG